jgi:hypothetical protein
MEAISRLPSLRAMSRSLLAPLTAARAIIICLCVGAGLARLFDLRDLFDRLLDAMNCLQNSDN